MKYSKDPTARGIARGFEKIPFTTKWSEKHERARDGKPSMHTPRCVCYRGGKRWSVRLTHRSTLFDAAFNDSLGNTRRLSDMALVLFWPHRIYATPGEPIPAKLFNFSEECARMDIQNEPEIVAQFEKLREALLKCEVLTPLEQVAAVRKDAYGTGGPSAPKTKQLIVDGFAKLDESITTQLIHTRELTKNIAGNTVLVDSAINNLHKAVGETAAGVIDSNLDAHRAVKESVGALAARVVNVQQLFGALNATHQQEMQALQSRLVMLEGKIQQQGEWLSDFSKRNMALDSKMGTVVELLNLISRRLTSSPTTVLATPAPATASVRDDKLSV